VGLWYRVLAWRSFLLDSLSLSLYLDLFSLYLSVCLSGRWIGWVKNGRGDGSNTTGTGGKEGGLLFPFSFFFSTFILFCLYCILCLHFSFSFHV
jgi:hypothetical protein